MTAEQFVKWSEGYYGNYNPVARADLITWLRDQVADRGEFFLAGLRERVRDEYSNVYKMPPDIAKLKEIHGVHPQETYDRGRRILAVAARKVPQIAEPEATDEQVTEMAEAARRLSLKVVR